MRLQAQETDIIVDRQKGKLTVPEEINSSASLSFLAGGGEMGERIRGFDWASTKLGPPEGWPQSLKTSIRIMLMSRQPVWIGWGKDLNYFYNDPYFSIIGGKHPWALGKPTREVWSEIWDVIGPMLDTALSGDEGTYVEAQLLIMERNGYPEETYYTFSYSPIPDDEGQPGGIFCANSEDTQRVIGQRELALLRDLAEKTAKSKSVTDVCERSIATLRTNLSDLPFAALYLVNHETGIAKLSGVSGIAEGHSLTPPEILLSDERFGFGRALLDQAPHVIGDLGETNGVPTGSWPVPPRAAIALPLVAAGEASGGGVLMVGLSPYRLLSETYLGFLKLVAGQIAAAISDAEATERERKRLEVLAELDRAKTAFFANVSHEFRTPLTLMLGPLQDVLSRDLGEVPPRVELELETARRNGLRLQKLVNTLLDFSRLEAGRMRAEFRPTELATFTAELASSFGSAVDNANLELKIECEPLPERVFVDRDLWEKVVFNLLSNAFKHTFEGSLKVGVHRRNDFAELIVSDTGIGIPASDLDHIFERFRRVEGSRARTHEGSGIGLALVQEIVKLHGGEISVDSHTDGPKRGSSFSVRVPFGSEHLSQDQVKEAASGDESKLANAYVSEASRWIPSVSREGEYLLGGQIEAAPVRSKGARVLVADDNADMRGYVGRLLGASYEVEVAPDGEAALSAIRTEAPDLVITDVMMPRLDGFGLVAALRNDPTTAHLPIIMLSARAGEESKIEGLDAGADDYLIKPFSARELLARVDSTLTLAKLRGDILQAQREGREQVQVALALAESERQRLKDLFMSAPAIICVLKGPEHTFELTNPQYLKLVGGASERVLLGKPIREALPELAGQGYFEILDRVYETGEPFYGNEMMAKLDRNGTGELEDAYLNLVNQPTRDASGAVDGILVHAVEVTEQVLVRKKVEELAQELEKRVERRTAELLHANEQLQGFTYSVAHDLRQQIRGISVNASIILSDLGDRLDRESQGHLQRLVRSAKQLAALVDDLLKYAKLAKLNPSLDNVNLSELAQEIANHMYDFQVCAQDAKFSIEPNLEVTGDAAMLRLVLENLLDNACKYSSLTADPLIEFGRDEQGFFVRDNGVGFDMAYAHKLFQPFERLHGDEKYAGTGIGLANVKRIIEKHGGRVWAQSEPGKGASFRFTL